MRSSRNETVRCNCRKAARSSGFSSSSVQAAGVRRGKRRSNVGGHGQKPPGPAATHRSKTKTLGIKGFTKAQEDWIRRKITGPLAFLIPDDLRYLGITRGVETASEPTTGDEYVAYVEHAYPYKSAEMTIGPGFWKLSAQEQFRVLAHECVHLNLAKMEALVRTTMISLIGPDEKSTPLINRMGATISGLFNDALEQTVEDFTDIVCDMLWAQESKASR